MARALHEEHQLTPERAAYYKQIDDFSMAPLWEVLHKILLTEPKTAAIPFIWEYERVRPHILESAEVISAAEAERRVLVLENPGLRGKTCITETLYAGLQLIMPGEVAPAHRHSPCALRFIVEGTGAYTSVNGEKAYMEPGDLILTPSWTWHDHGHDGTDPVVWMDGLDIPLVSYMGPVFTELYPEETFPEGRPGGDNIARYGANMRPVGATFTDENSPVFHYPYARTREALDKMSKAVEWDPYHGLKMEYVNPINGGTVMPTITCFNQLLPKGFKSETYQSTGAFIYSVIEGTGKTVIGDQTISWGPRDTFVVPMWYPHHHEANDDAVLFSFSDEGLQKKMGLWREKRGNG